MNYNTKECGKRVQMIRKQMKMTQEEFADRLGIAESTVGNIESGRRGLTVDLALEIAKMAKVSLDYLYSGDTPRTDVFKKKIQEMIKVMIEMEKQL